jgi:hypothetical protein
MMNDKWWRDMNGSRGVIVGFLSKPVHGKCGCPLHLIGISDDKVKKGAMLTTSSQPGGICCIDLPMKIIHN